LRTHLLGTQERVGFSVGIAVFALAGDAHRLAFLANIVAGRDVTADALAAYVSAAFGGSVARNPSCATVAATSAEPVNAPICRTALKVIVAANAVGAAGTNHTLRVRCVFVDTLTVLSATLRVGLARSPIRQAWRLRATAFELRIAVTRAALFVRAATDGVGHTQAAAADPRLRSGREYARAVAALVGLDA